ncbi:MAG: sigma-70 family RNA polymerase sigma factor [Planctomycetota bacterium]
MSPPSSSSFESLLSHASFLRSLARELTRDASRADDLVQRTWVAALEHPPSEGKPLRRWLAAIVRNFAREEHRTEARRAHREAIVARPIAGGEPDELGEQIALQHSLLRAVEGLDEPYRSVIYQRYYENRSPREIAAGSGIPLKTVKTQLHRGLAKLRARLDREHGGERSAWLLALIPLTGRPSWTAYALGAQLVNAKIQVAFVCLAVICAVGGVAFVSSRMETPSAAASAASIADSARVEKPAGPAVTALASGERRSLEAPNSAAAPAPVAEASIAVVPEASRIRGRVLDLQGRPVSGIELVERSEFVSDRVPDRSRGQAQVPRAIAISAADGSFEVAAPAPKSTLVLVARSASFVTVLGVRLARNYSAAEPIVAVAPSQPLAGLVVDPEGKPVADAQVEILLPASVRSGIGAVIDQSFLMAWKISTDERGRFEFEDAPDCTGELCASSPRFEKASIPIPPQSSYDLLLRLGARAKPKLMLRGIVVDEHGAPVDQAFVGFADRTTRSAADGSFELDVDVDPNTINYVQDPPGSGSWGPEFDLDLVRAVKAGHLPAIHRLPEFDERHALAELDPIRLELGGAPLSIQGRVQDSRGRPVAGVEVWPADGTFFGRITYKTGREGASFPAILEAVMRGDPRAEKTRSDAEGKFVLDGLCDREYEIAAFDASTLRWCSMSNVRAGRSDVVVQLQSQEELVRIAGRVVTEAGAPVPGVMVTPSMNLTHDGMQSFGASTTTDEKGRFSFLGEDPGRFQFSCSSETILPVMMWQPKPGQSLDSLEIVVWLRCHLQVDLGDRKQAADAFAALDASGKRTPIMAFHGPMMTFGEFSKFDDGKSEVVIVRDSCRSIVLYLDGKEVGRLPLSLRSGELNVVRW